VPGHFELAAVRAAADDPVAQLVVAVRLDLGAVVIAQAVALSAFQPAQDLLVSLDVHAHAVVTAGEPGVRPGRAGAHQHPVRRGLDDLADRLAHAEPPRAAPGGWRARRVVRASGSKIARSGP
jgi:hypothetical protein